MAKAAIQVAIIGGGLGGTVLMNSLMKYPHIDAHIYEAKSTFKERGASVGLAPNAQRALRLMELGEALQRARGVPVNGARCIMGEGPDVGETVINLELELLTVHRAALLRELLEPIPEDRMHINKRLVSIESGKVAFDDGTTITADVIIGADGIHSSVRQYVLGKEHPAVEPVYAGMWDSRTVIPYGLALARLGPEIITCQTPRQTLYIGDGVVLLSDYIDDCKSVCIIAAGRIPPGWERGNWKHVIRKEWLLEQVQEWPTFASEMIKLLCGDQEEISAFVEWESASTPRLYNGNTCIMGDAAHATTPWQGAGLGQAIEDALIIQTVLGQCDRTEDVPTAFEAYDQLMRPRGQRVIDSSRSTGFLLLCEGGLDAKKVGDSLRGKWDFMHDWDTEGAVKEVIEACRQSKASNGTKA